MHGIDAKFSGRVGETPTLKLSPAGINFVWLKVIVSQPPDGKGKVYDMWVTVTCFGELAETIATNASIAQYVYSEGVITEQKWKRTDGSKGSCLHLKPRRVDLLGSTEASGANNGR